MSNNNDNYELEYYLEIIDYFQNQDLDSQTTEIWKNKSFIELMKVLKRTKKKEFVKNAIILILTLFEKLPPESFNSRGTEVDSLSDGDKLSYVNILKTEFVNDLPN